MLERPGVDPRVRKTFDGVFRIRQGIGTFRFVPLVALVASVFLLAFALAAGTPGVGSFPPTPRTPTGSETTSVGGIGIPNSELAGLAVGAVLGLLILGISLLAWWRWTGGLIGLQRGGSEYGLDQARAARWGRRVYYGVISSAVLYIAFVELLNFALVGQAQVYAQDVRSGMPPAVLSSAAANIDQTVFWGTLVGWGILVVMIGFGAASLRLSIRTISNQATRVRLDRGATLMVVGAGLLGLQLLYLINPWMVFLSIVGDAVVFLGLTEMFRGYGQWLWHPATVRARAAG